MKELAKAIKQAALIIALAMLGCAVIEYITFHEPTDYEESDTVVEIPI